MQHIEQAFQVNYNFNVFFTEDLFGEHNSILIDVLDTGANGFVKKLLIFADAGIVAANPNFTIQINKYFDTHSCKINLVSTPIVIEGGEWVKNDEKQVDSVLKAINEHGIDRHSYTMAIGGGALLDMVGYASAIAHRGIRHIRVPSTVLSQNDSGVGVKNSINYFGKKNFLGTFVPPYAVFNDYSLLELLPLREWRCGIAEAIKVALIKDLDFFDFIENNALALANRDKAAMQYMIYRCAQLHLQHIASGDPFEKGSSRPLDFGHWAAHKMEHLSNYQIKHGEAVAAGIALDVTYSWLEGRISESDWKRVMELLKAVGFPLFYKEMKPTNAGANIHNPLLTGLDEFREHLGGRLTIMLLQQIGRGIEVNEMSEEIILAALDKLETYQ